MFGCKRVTCDKIDGDRPRQPANRNCYRLSRVSWALAQLFCLTHDAAGKEFRHFKAFFLSFQSLREINFCIFCIDLYSSRLEILDAHLLFNTGYATNKVAKKQIMTLAAAGRRRMSQLIHVAVFVLIVSSFRPQFWFWFHFDNNKQ